MAMCLILGDDLWMSFIDFSEETQSTPGEEKGALSKESFCEVKNTVSNRAESNLWNGRVCQYTSNKKLLFRIYK